MKWLGVGLLVSVVAGCASGPSQPMTDEQRQLAMQYLLSRPQQPQPQPYVLPIPAAPVRPQQCISNVNGQSIYTNCY